MASNLRAILPKIDSSDPPSIPRSSSPPSSSRRNVVVACQACKRRKTRASIIEKSSRASANPPHQCDGETPQCSMCMRKGSTCEYVEAQATLDQLKRENGELSKRNEQYSTLLSCLKTGTLEETNEILSRIRSGPSIEAVLDHIEHGKLLLSPTEHIGGRNFSSSGSETAEMSKGSTKRKFGDADVNDDAVPPKHSPSSVRSNSGTTTNASITSKATNPDRLSVSFLTTSTPSPGASAWTNVTTDDALITALVNDWFAFYHPWLPFIEKELFFEAFAAGPNAQPSTFCSPLLVNSIAASACHLSEPIQGKTSPWSDDFIGKQFLEECFRLWHEDSQECLTNIQSAIILADVLTHDADDRRGMTYLLTACQLARSLGLLRDPLSWDGAPRDRRGRDNWHQAMTVAVWGLFHYQAMTCYSLNRFPLIRRPPIVDVPYQNEDTDINKILFRAECQLAVILNELGTLHFSDNDGYAGFDASVEKTEEMYQRLLSFKTNLHPKLTTEPDGEPSTLLLQIHLQYIIVSLFLPYVDANRLSPAQKFYASRSATESRVALASLRQLIYLSSYCFGFGRCPYYIAHILLFDGLTALDELKRCQIRQESAPTDAYTSLMGSIIGLGEMAQRFVVCEARLKALKVKSDEIGVHLSLRARQALNVVNQPGWLSKARAHFRSSIPLFLATDFSSSPGGDNPDSVRLDNMLKTWSLKD